MENHRNHLLIAAALGLAFTRAASVFAGSGPAFTGPTVIYFVRHAENESSTPNQALTQQGEARTRLFTATVRDIPFGHVLSSHTTRSRQTVEAVAKARGLSVIQLPKPGSIVDEAPLTIKRLPKLQSNP